jgi:hypothetical protein
VDRTTLASLEAKDVPEKVFAAVFVERIASRGDLPAELLVLDQ